MIEIFPEWFQIFFGSMIPWLEARYIIPYAIVILHWNWWEAFPIAIIGNFLPIPFILLFFKYVEKFLRRYKFWTKRIDWLFERTRKKADNRIKRYEYLGLLIFVVIPLPFTGAWTGTLIAYLFDLDFTKSLMTIFIGLVIAAVIMITLTITGQYIFLSFNS